MGEPTSKWDAAKAGVGGGDGFGDRNVGGGLGNQQRRYAGAQGSSTARAGGSDGAPSYETQTITFTASSPAQYFTAGDFPSVPWSGRVSLVQFTFYVDDLTLGGGDPPYPNPRSWGIVSRSAGFPRKTCWFPIFGSDPGQESSGSLTFPRTSSTLPTIGCALREGTADGYLQLEQWTPGEITTP